MNRIFSFKVLSKSVSHMSIRMQSNSKFDPYEGMSVAKIQDLQRKCKYPICNLEIRPVPRTNSEKCRVANFLGKNYFTDEPLLIATGIGGSKQPNPGILNYLLQYLNDNKALYAQVQESREILGLIVARTTTPTTVYELRALADKMATPQSRRYISLLAQIEERSNIYKQYQTNKAWSVDLLAVNRYFRRRGIAKKLLEEMKRMAEKEKDKFDVMRFTASNHYGSSAARKCGGMKSFFKRGATTFKDARGAPWVTQEVCDPHGNVEVFTRSLKDVRQEKKKDVTCEKYGLEKYLELK